MLFDEAEALAAVEPASPEVVSIPAHKRRKRGRKRIPAQLPRIEVVHDLPEAEKLCAHDGTVLERIGEEAAEQLVGRLGIELSRATMASWMIKLGGTHVVPIVNLLADQLLEARLLHMDETRVQVLRSDQAPTADHWIWVRCTGPPGRRVVLFDDDPSRGGQVPADRLRGDLADGRL